MLEPAYREHELLVYKVDTYYRTARYMRYTVRVAGYHGIPFIYLFTWRIVYPPRYPYIDSTAAVFLSSSPAILLSLHDSRT